MELRAGTGLWGKGVGMEGSSKKKERKEKELMDMDNSVVIVRDEGWVEVEEGIEGINANGKTTIKFFR